MTDRAAFHAINTKQILPSFSTVEISEFQAAIKDCLGCTAFVWSHIDFWNEVISMASAKQIRSISFDQRPYLADWIKANFYWFTEGWSRRQQIQLRYRLMELMPPNLTGD